MHNFDLLALRKLQIIRKFRNIYLSLFSSMARDAILTRENLSFFNKYSRASLFSFSCDLSTNFGPCSSEYCSYTIRLQSLLVFTVLYDKRHHLNILTFVEIYREKFFRSACI